MWECNYAREPINYRLFFLKLLKKIWILPLAAVLGAVIIGGIYYVINMVAGDGHQYRARTMYYVKYSVNANGDEADYYNYYTWQELLDTQYFVDGMYEAMGGSLSREYIVEKVTATVEADYRYLYSRSISGDKQQSIEMEKKLSELIVNFAATKDEIETIEIVDEATEASIEDVSLIFEGHAVVIGIIVGLFVAVLGLIFYECTDTSVYIPATLEKRYHIATLGAPSMSEFAVNCKEFIGDKHATVVDTDGLSEEKIKAVFESKYDISVCANPMENVEQLESLKNENCVLLAVKAGAHNGKRIERILEQFARQKISVTAFLLMSEDKWLIAKYYK